MKKFTIIIIILVLAVAVWYYLDIRDDAVIDEGLDPQSIEINADTTESIEQDLEALDVEALEAELNSLDQELENL